jgi:hypothetical protein
LNQISNSIQSAGTGTYNRLVVEVLSAPRSAERNSPPKRQQLSDVIKKGRAQQLIHGVEEHVIDNSRSGSTVTKTLTVTREWACTYTIEHQHDHKTVDTSTIQVRDGVTKARSVENALRNRFAYTHGSKHVYQENVEVVIPPFKKMRVLLNWKNILEVGSVVLRDQYDAGIELPFAIVIGVTFDQAQIDE